jgi:rhodanese-related sulfurtransferase
MPNSHWKEAKDGFILDVREPFELSVENIPGATNIPIAQLRSRLEELPKDQEVHVICRSGQRAYYATRILLQNGFKVKNVSGGMISYAHNYLFEADLTGREV